MIYQIKNGSIVEIDPVMSSVEKFYENFVPDQSLIIFDGVTLNNLEIPSGITYLIYDKATNPVDINHYITELDLLDNSFIVTGLYHFHKNPHPNPKIKFFPFWAVWMSYQNYQFSSDLKKYKISCLNGIPREHRKLVYLMLREKDYFKDMIFTFGHRPGLHQNFENNWHLSEQEQTLFECLPQNVEFLPSDRDGIDITTYHPAFQETYVNLVTETTVRADTPMLSEKTFKPIATGQLFVLIASPGAIQFLRDIGFDTFDDIIDHGYDQITDIRKRIELALVQIDNLAQMDLESIYETIKPRLLKNSQYLRSNAFRNQFILNFG